MVVTRLPATADTGSTQVRVAAPSRCTVHAPHCAMPQPNLVHVRPSVSRSTQRRGVSAATVTVRGRPFKTKETGGMGSLTRVACPKPHRRYRSGEGGSGIRLREVLLPVHLYQLEEVRQCERPDEQSQNAEVRHARQGAEQRDERVDGG